MIAKAKSGRIGAVQAFCPTCERTTVWLVRQGGNQWCDGCGDRFPCAHHCQHLDCTKHRREAVSRVHA